MSGIRKILLVLAAILIEVNSGSFDNSISFFVYPKNGSPIKYANNNRLTNLGCSTFAPWTFIVHGYRTSPEAAKWIPVMAARYSKYRGGCVIVMDYSHYTLNTEYSTLLGNFNGISAVLLKKVNQVLEEGFTADKGFLFGFSFGTELVFDVGIKTGGRISRIDACEPPGIGFENANRDPKKAAKNVQCIHTSTIFGTKKRECHQDWLMGDCGVLQSSVGYLLSHGVCPDIYNSAFENNFYAESNPMNCQSNVGKITKYYPSKLRMGYRDTRITSVRGTLFSRTYTTSSFAAR